MKRSVALLILAFAFGATTAYADTPAFRLGFKVLADQIPDFVGQPMENEHYNPINGDSLQQTTTGLMAWRKADNWTAFTNGALTWVNGPFGVQVRPNDQRFSWEAPATQLAMRTDPPASAPAPPPPQAPTPARVQAPAAGPAEAAAELAALDMINKSRADNGVGPLVMDETLRLVARADAKDMSVRNFFGHTNPDGLQPWDRARAAGITYSIFAENIGWGQGYPTPTDSVRVNHQSMMAETPPEDGHRVNILNARLKKVGIGVYRGADGKVFFVCDFYA